MSLTDVDPEISHLCKAEKDRQRNSLEMIASENFASRAVAEALASCFSNKYSEGQVGIRFNGGNQFIDVMEGLCQKRALELFGLDPKVWGVNVQPYSGSPANFAIYTALVGPHGRIMGLDSMDGGHPTHGFQSPDGHKVSATSLYFESMPYKVDPTTGLIDYNALERSARLFRPKLIIAGISAHPRNLNYARFRTIADSVSAILMGDMAHVSGLVAAGVHPSPFEYCDVVSTTTHKTLRGPRGAMIFYRKVGFVSRKTNKAADSLPNGHTTTDFLEPTDFEQRINAAVFPGLQSGPHNNVIASLAVALKEANSPKFKAYQHQTIKNTQQLCASLKEFGYTLATNGSDNHMCLIDLRPLKLDGIRADRFLDQIGIVCNRNTIPGDAAIPKPGGIRLGSPALTSRGLCESDFKQVAELIHKGLQAALVASELAGPKMADFEAVVTKDDKILSLIESLKKEVENFASQFPMPGLADI